MKTPITPEVRAVLEQSAILGNTLTLPEQLDRALYVAVNKVLVGLGGKWDKRSKTHIFPRDPRLYLAEALDTGESRNLQQERQAFSTPPSLAADLIRAHLSIEPGDTVLEPSAGRGALALAAAEYTDRGNIWCYDTDPEVIPVLRREMFIAIEADFLTVEPKTYYDWVIMNPPFAGGQDIAHVLHALSFVKPGGTLLAIPSAMAGRGSPRAHREFARSMEMYDAVRQPLDPSSFKESGTDVNAACWVVGMPVGVTTVIELPSGKMLGSPPISPPVSPPISPPPPPLVLQAVQCQSVHGSRIAQYQVIGSYMTATWEVVEVEVAPRYCRECAESQAGEYRYQLARRSMRSPGRREG